MALQPQGLPPGFKPSIPPTIPLEQTDPERQRIYGELAAAAKELEAPLEIDNPTASDTVALPAVPTAKPAAAVAVQEVVYLPTDDDKKEFVRSILAAKPYEKTYVLFGAVEAAFVDRSPEDTMNIYARLDKLTGARLIATDEEWQVELERARLAVTLRAVKGGALAVTLPEGLNERVMALLKLPRPLYEALMEACRQFEGHIDYMVERATDPNFWRTGGGI